jgi:katanin p80 WD40 repeat-containing subunit B1
MLDEKEARQAIVSVVKTKDNAIAIDIMKQMMKPDHVKRFMTLDICLFLLPLLQELFQSPHEDYVITALKMTAILYECFHKIIRETLNQNSNAAPGIDLHKEDRVDKCLQCKVLFEKLQKTADIRFKHQLNEMGSYGRQLLRLMREKKL